jgi:hypothetical protein
MRKGIVQEIAYAPYITPEPFTLEKEAIDASKTAFFFGKWF